MYANSDKCFSCEYLVRGTETTINWNCILITPLKQKPYTMVITDFFFLIEDT